MLFSTPISKRSFFSLFVTVLILANVCTNVVSANESTNDNADQQQQNQQQNQQQQNQEQNQQQQTTTTQQGYNSNIGQFIISQCDNAPILVSNLQIFCTRTDNVTGITTDSSTCSTGDIATLIVDISVTQDLGDDKKKNRQLAWYNFWQNNSFFNGTIFDGTLSNVANVTNATLYNATNATEYFNHTNTNENTALGFLTIIMSPKSSDNKRRRLENSTSSIMALIQNGNCCECFAPETAADQACPSNGNYEMMESFSFPFNAQDTVVTEAFDIALSIKKNEDDSVSSISYVTTGDQQVNQEQCASDTAIEYSVVSFMEDAALTQGANNTNTTNFFSDSSTATAAAIAASASMAVACVGFLLWKSNKGLTGGKREIKLNDDDTQKSGNLLNSGNFLNNFNWV
jgi:hypothetical protein